MCECVCVCVCVCVRVCVCVWVRERERVSEWERERPLARTFARETVCDRMGCLSRCMYVCVCV